MKIKVHHSKTTKIASTLWLTTIVIFILFTIYLNNAHPKTNYIYGELESGFLLFDVLVGIVSFIVLVFGVINDNIKARKIVDSLKKEHTNSYTIDNSISGKIAAGLDDIIFV